MKHAPYDLPANQKAAMPEAATRNACKLCTPLGAAMVFKGIRGCLPFLHGSQGCATYIRRYMISHFREPVDIASSSFSEEDAIFGGANNFATGVENVIRQYQPEIIGVATTCLSETIGENMLGMIKTYQDSHDGTGAPLVHVSTPAYAGTHSEGFHAALREVIRHFNSGKTPEPVAHPYHINLLPGMVTCADLRYFRELCHEYGITSTLLPDYNETLEGGSWDTYHRMSPGGTSLEEIKEMHRSVATIEIGHSLTARKDTGAAWLEAEHGVPRHALGWPLGIRLSDEFHTTLSTISGHTMPERFAAQRSRLVDAYIDAHKYTAGRRAVIFGDPDLVIGLAALVSEMGIRPVLCATGAKLKNWEKLLSAEIEDGVSDVEILSGADHAKIAAKCREMKPDLLIGSSKAYPIASELNIPIIRCGFPIHDRVGAQRQHSVVYRGTQELFDRIVNALLETKQEDSSTGYSYI